MFTPMFNTLRTTKLPTRWIDELELRVYQQALRVIRLGLQARLLGQDVYKELLAYRHVASEHRGELALAAFAGLLVMKVLLNLTRLL